MRQTEGPYRVTPFVEATGEPMFAVLGPEGVVMPVARWLSWMSLNGGSINTIEAYARNVSRWLNFLTSRNLAWNANLDFSVLETYVVWLRKGDVLDARVRIIPINLPNLRRETTIDTYLAAVYKFYTFHPDSPLGRRIRVWREQNVVRKPGRYWSARPITARKDPDDGGIKETLSRDQMNALVEACDTYRNKLFVAMQTERALRVGQLLGMRHDDFRSLQSLYFIRPRHDNVNGARAKVGKVHVLPLNPFLIELHTAYMYDEYGDVDCDYVFINLKGESRGEPMTYQGGIAYLRQKLVKRTGIEFHWHMLRRSCATDLAWRGVPLVAVQKLLCHVSPTTTSDVYVHINADQLRDVLDGRDRLNAVRDRRRPDDEIPTEELRALLNADQPLDDRGER